MSNSGLFEQAELSDPSRVPDWLMNEYRSFHRTVVDDDFPCSFGMAAEMNRELRYAFVENNDLTRLPETLNCFLRLSRSHPDVRHNLTVFFEPEAEPKTFEHYKNRFWQVLNFLHEHDSAPWPREIPTDKDDPLWEFCFGGDPIFMFAASPAYVQRRSRNYGNSFVMLFQPKRIFKGIESESAAGTKVRRVIRSRLKKWDGTASLHPDVIDYGEALIYRWKQYLLSDDSTPATGGCPFHFGKTQDDRGRRSSPIIRSEGENR
ncbi:YqcI/YcgG family protein [uncultured Bradyrhizobium sp.]|uniref:YqcI/YcgG family protein n=1 Tax=uncultured Bradyrhizobium sp. TaxID=199684 RepID=UPI0035CB2AA4